METLRKLYEICLKSRLMASFNELRTISNRLFVGGIAIDFLKQKIA